MVKVVLLAHIIGKGSYLDEEVEHFKDELGLSEGVISICCKLLAFVEPFNQHGNVFGSHGCINLTLLLAIFWG